MLQRIQSAWFLLNVCTTKCKQIYTSGQNFGNTCDFTDKCPIYTFEKLMYMAKVFFIAAIHKKNILDIQNNIIWSSFHKKILYIHR